MSKMDFRSNEADRIARNDGRPHALFSLVVTTQARGSWSLNMDYAKPSDVVASMVDASIKKLALGPRDLLTRGALSAISLTNMGKSDVAGVAPRIVAVAEAKTVANAALGTAGMVSVFVNGILCNWPVCLGLVMAMTSTVAMQAAAE
jgi:hypothetical protein